MERGNTKHGPAHDEEMARETQGLIHGGAHSAHAEEWRQPEPADEAFPPVRRGGANPQPQGRDYELRSELARVVSRDWFPAGRAAVLARLRDSDSPQDLTERVSALPEDSHFDNPRDVLVALGINSPETRNADNPEE
ncbi:MAG TPA: DUF2795 domain-containing protein [Trebonia sp.]|nr:DUF2795 domain-containing protein [Trebonia sp.]